MEKLSTIPSTTLIHRLNLLYAQKIHRGHGDTAYLDVRIGEYLNELRQRTSLTKGLLDPQRSPSPYDQHPTSPDHPLLMNRVSIL